MELKKIVSSMGLVFLSGALLTGCAGSDGSDGSDGAAGVAPTLEEVTAAVMKLHDTKRVLETNADIALAAYSDSVDTAIALKAAIATFKTTPDAANFTAAKAAWLVSREPYGQTEVYRFRLSPIDSTDYAEENGPEGDINAWPLGEALIDYVTTGADFGDDQVGVSAHATSVNGGNSVAGSEDPQTNIINTTALTINGDLLAENMGAADENERDVIAGYHAIEFMLWGQDLNSDGSATTPRDATAGHRPLTDFTTDANASRRFDFMEIVVDKLIADLEQVRDAWKSGATYRVAFTSPTTQADADKKIEEILTGMGTLSEGELAGERMQIALVNNSQEDEHSCFSDNTHRDVWLNAEGVSNSWYGVYKGYDSTGNGVDDNGVNEVEGYGLNQYIRTYGTSSLAEQLELKLATTELGYGQIDDLARAGTPFDLQIMDPTATNAAKVKATISALNAQSVAIQAIATDLGLGDVVLDDASECNTADPTAGC